MLKECLYSVSHSRPPQQILFISSFTSGNGVRGDGYSSLLSALQHRMRVGDGWYTFRPTSSTWASEMSTNDQMKLVQD